MTDKALQPYLTLFEHDETCNCGCQNKSFITLNLKEYYKNQNIKLEELVVKDFMGSKGVSNFTKYFSDERKKLNGIGAKSFLLINCEIEPFDTDENGNLIGGYVDFNFLTEKTKKYPDNFNLQRLATSKQQPNNFNLISDNVYQETIRFEDFFDYLSTTPFNLNEMPHTEIMKEFKDILTESDIKLWCSCPSTQWTGLNFRLSQVNSSLFPTNIAPKDPVYDANGKMIRQGWKTRTSGGMICKHLDLLMNSIMFFIPQMSMMLKKQLGLTLSKQAKKKEPEATGEKTGYEDTIEL